MNRPGSPGAAAIVDILENCSIDAGRFADGEYTKAVCLGYACCLGGGGGFVPMVG